MKQRIYLLVFEGWGGGEDQDQTFLFLRSGELHPFFLLERKRKRRTSGALLFRCRERQDVSFRRLRGKQSPLASREVGGACLLF